MSASTFREAIRESPDVCEQVLQLLTARIRLLDARVAEFSSLGVRDRIHAQLLRLGRIRSTQPNEALISPPPVQAEFAAQISTHREAVAREFKALERAGLLERRRGAVVIRDVRTLTTMLERASDQPF